MENALCLAKKLTHEQVNKATGSNLSVNFQKAKKLFPTYLSWLTGRFNLPNWWIYVLGSCCYVGGKWPQSKLNSAFDFEIYNHWLFVTSTTTQCNLFMPQIISVETSSPSSRVSQNPPILYTYVHRTWAWEIPSKRPVERQSTTKLTLREAGQAARRGIKTACTG